MASVLWDLVCKTSLGKVSSLVVEGDTTMCLYFIRWATGVLTIGVNLSFFIPLFLTSSIVLPLGFKNDLPGEITSNCPICFYFVRTDRVDRLLSILPCHCIKAGTVVVVTIRERTPSIGSFFGSSMDSHSLG